MDAPGKTDAAVLVPVFHRDGELVAVFTERRADLRRHAGEISFPGGRQDFPDEDLRTTALREAEEEVGLGRDDVELVGALPPVGTFVTGYRVFPFVGLIEPGPGLGPAGDRGRAGARAVAGRPVRGHEHKRLVRRGVPIRTPTYTVDGHLVWGATARIVAAAAGAARAGESCLNASRSGHAPDLCPTGPRTEGLARPRTLGSVTITMDAFADGGPRRGGRRRAGDARRARRRLRRRARALAVRRRSRPARDRRGRVGPARAAGSPSAARALGGVRRRRLRRPGDLRGRRVPERVIETAEHFEPDAGRSPSAARRLASPGSTSCAAATARWRCSRTTCARRRESPTRVAAREAVDASCRSPPPPTGSTRSTTLRAAGRRAARRGARRSRATRRRRCSPTDRRTAPGTSTAGRRRRSTSRSCGRSSSSRDGDRLCAALRRRRGAADRRRLPAHRRGPPARTGRRADLARRAAARTVLAGTLARGQPVRHAASPTTSSRTPTSSEMIRFYLRRGAADRVRAHLRPRRPRGPRRGLRRGSTSWSSSRATATAARASSSARAPARGRASDVRREVAARAERLHRPGAGRRSPPTRPSAAGGSSRATSTCGRS